ncbi:MAG: hypothetical protein JWP78_3024 [Mucilaginibacter sp.]|nr:hypothetical protein [Mucilaginibacter sp.]
MLRVMDMARNTHVPGLHYDDDESSESDPISRLPVSH